MKTAFLGAVRFSACCLDILDRLGHRPSMVYGLVREARHRHSDYRDITSVAREMGLSSQRITHAWEMDLTGVDLLWVLGWSELLPPDILCVPRLGCIGSHPSLLPHGRGRHPIIHAILQEWSCTGLTFFWLDEGMDTGDIAVRKMIPLRLDVEDAGTLYRKVELAAEDLLRWLLPRLLSGDYPRRRQPYGSYPVLPHRVKGDEMIHWTQPAKRILCQIRALTAPYLGARAVLNGREIIIWSAGEEPTRDRGLFFEAADGKKIWIKEWQFA